MNFRIVEIDLEDNRARVRLEEVEWAVVHTVQLCKSYPGDKILLFTYRVDGPTRDTEYLVIADEDIGPARARKLVEEMTEEED